MLENFSTPFWFTSPVMQTVVGNLSHGQHPLPSGIHHEIRDITDTLQWIYYPVKKSGAPLVVLVPNWGQSQNTGIILRQIIQLKNLGYNIAIPLPSPRERESFDVSHYFSDKVHLLKSILQKHQGTKKTTLIGFGLGASAILTYASKFGLARIDHVIALSPLLDLKRIHLRFLKAARGLFANFAKTNVLEAIREAPYNDEIDFTFAKKACHINMLMSTDDPFISSLDLRLAQGLNADVFERGGHCGFVTMKGIMDQKSFWIDEYIADKLERHQQATARKNAQFTSPRRPSQLEH